MNQALENFLKSDDFQKGVIASTRASWGGSGYSVELLEDGTYQGPIWNNQIGNLYTSPGIILSIPQVDDSDYQEAVNDHGMPEDEFLSMAFYNDEQEIAQSMREALVEA